MNTWKKKGERGLGKDTEKISIYSACTFSVCVCINLNGNWVSDLMTVGKFLKIKTCMSPD